MKILLVNKFFYPRGGDCVVAMATRRLLQEKGHDVRVFAMNFESNLPLADARGYASEVTFGGGMGQKAKAFARILGKGDIIESASKALDDFQPDVVHLHNVHSYLSPIIGELAHKRGIRVVWTLHDFKLLCPSYSCRRTTGENCEECIKGSLHVVEHRCMKGSMPQSLMADIEARVWNRKRVRSFTDLFIAPSRFMHNKMLEGGFSADSLCVVHNFIDPEKMEIISRLHPAAKRDDYFCYVGRLSEEKGTETMLKAAAEAGVKLMVAGGGPLLAEMKRRFGNEPGIEFLGHLSAEDTVHLLHHSKASIMPSECYENNPLSVIESLACGTPVIGASIGGIPELLHRSNGVDFTSGNAEELARILADFDKRSPFDHEAISRQAIKDFSAERYYRQLMQTYKPSIV